MCTYGDFEPKHTTNDAQIGQLIDRSVGCNQNWVLHIHTSRLTYMYKPITYESFKLNNLGGLKNNAGFIENILVQ